ncbi:MAG: TmcC family electron transfer complex membrane anchor subunit [Desulfococcaceae bacterium]
MHTLHNLVAGPLAWLAFLVFIGGSIYKLATMAREAKQKDPLVYEYWSTTHAVQSMLHWLTPFGSRNWRINPVLTIVTFAFHVCLILVPIFAFAHIVLWKEAFDVSWMALPEGLTDLMTMVVIFGCVYFLIRRLTKPDVKYLTSRSDFVILAIVGLPFLTGYWASQGWFAYKLVYILHMLTGEIMLAAIPFTRLAHALYFPFTRGYIGSEFGAVRHARDW